MKAKQAQAPAPHFFGAEAFQSQNKTTVRWLAGSGAMINCHGTILMIDPVLKGFDMPLLVDAPLKTEDVPKVDVLLITHSDNDHFSKDTCRDLAPVCGSFHAPHYVAGLADFLGSKAFGHDIGDSFSIGPATIRLTPADHDWQNSFPGVADRVFQKEDFCGFWIDTPDGSIWAIGDSRLMEEHLHMPVPDLILFDFSDSEFHIGLSNAVRLANTYPDTPLLLWHWGCVDAPDMDPFNGDPAELKARILNPDRALVLAPGEPLTLKKLSK